VDAALELILSARDRGLQVAADRQQIHRIIAEEEENL
jgi:hypothetical protein